MSFLNGKKINDWGIQGTAGIFTVGLGPRGADGNWVDGAADWNSWLDWGTQNRFGVWRYAGAQGAYNHFDNMRTLGEWGSPFWVKVTLSDDFKFNFGYLLDNGSATAADATGSQSYINGTFMFSGNVGEMITFDLFYAVKGEDTDTLSRPADYFGYNAPSASWLNNLGAYVQIKGIENLAVSVGYSLYFKAYEEAGFLKNDGSTDPIQYIAPAYSGVDLRLAYTGIDKIGLKWINNFSFANAKADKIENGEYKKTVHLLFDESAATAAVSPGVSQNWFHWGSILRARLGFIEDVDLEAALGYNLGVAETKENSSITPVVGGTTTETKSSDKDTYSRFAFVVGAKYGAGAVTLGVALAFDWVRTVAERSSKVTTTTGGVSGTIENTYTKIDDVVRFGIPVTFNVSF